MWRAEKLRGQEVYLDSNIIIYAFEGMDATSLRGLKVIFSDLATGVTHARTSLITRAEVLVRPLRDKQDELVRVYSELLSGTKDITVQAVDVDIVDHAAALRARHDSLRLPDALHLATAIHCHCRYFLTSDRRLATSRTGIEALTLQEMDQG